MPRGSSRRRRRGSKQTRLRQKQQGKWLESSLRFHEQLPVVRGERPERPLSSPEPRQFKGQPLLSVVTGSYNRAAGLARLVCSVRSSLRTDVPYEVIVVDGGSTDGTTDWCRQQPDVILVEGDLEGAVPNFNKGFALARGRYVCMGNDDVEFAGDSLQLVVDYMAGHPRCGAGCIPHARPPSVPPWVSLMNVEIGGRVLQWPMAQVAVVPKWLGDELGWWGTVTAHYHGDQLLSRRIWESGFTCSVVPDVWLRDFATQDGLRQRNAKLARGANDARAYKNVYPTAPRVGVEPVYSPPFETKDGREPDVDIVLGTYNRLKFLQQCVESARRAAQGLRHHFIVVDGGSTDGSLEWLREQGDVELIATGVLDGAIKAFNRGFVRATAEFVVNANDDMVFEKPLLPARDYLLANLDVGQLAFPTAIRGENKHKNHNCWGNTFANFGMTRRWLGDYVGWWGNWTQKYFGDVHCSLKIWELGYRVEVFGGVTCRDYLPQDALRGPDDDAFCKAESRVFELNWPTRGRDKHRKPYVSVPDSPLVRKAEFE